MAPEDRDELIEEWLDQWEESQEDGETLAPEVLCRDQPELLTELKRRIAELVRLDGFLAPAATAAHEDEPFVEIQAGRYRAKRLHAPGGLGEVFYANDDELKREVALKRLRPSVAWSREARHRFVLEAEITGRLEHPGVVPVYGLGRDQQGNPYYAMRFIRGKTLDQATEELHKNISVDPEKRQQGLRSLLSALRSSCQTIAYAHAHGVLHRDLKPSNIILGEYGEVLVIDWGLAKTWDPAAPAQPQSPQRPETKPTLPPAKADPNETADFHLDATEIGQIKGTPAYMSPEQAEGNPASPASDIYGLGATLYKVLTGRAPFTGESALAIVRKVQAHELVAPRQVKLSIPAALEAICLKAMQKDPAQRYVSALELAQDLANWLDDVPTSAWPEPWTMRARRWVRKNNSIVVGVAAAFSMFALFLGFSTIRERTLNQQLRVAVKAAEDAKARAEKEKQQAEFQAKRADTNYQQARGVVQNMLFKTNHPRWNDVPKIQQLQREQTELVLGFFETIAAQPGQDLSVRADVAWGLIEAGKLQVYLGKVAEGKEKIRRAAVATEKIYADGQGEPRIILLRSEALLAHGSFLDTAEGVAVIKRGVEVLEDGRKKHPESPFLRDALIFSLITYGGALVTQKDFQQAETRLEQAVRLCEENLKAKPDDQGFLGVTARARVNLCAAYRQLQKGPQTREQHALAERELERLFKLDPFDHDTIDGLAILRVNGAYDLAAEGKKAEAVEYLLRNVPMLEAALKLEPDDATMRDRIYRTHGLRAEFLRQLGKTREAAELWEKSLPYAIAADKPLRLVEAIEYWMAAPDNSRAVEAAKRAQAEIPIKSPIALWQRQSRALERLATLVEKDEGIPADDRPQLAADLRADAAKAREHARAGINPIETFLDMLKMFNP